MLQTRYALDKHVKEAGGGQSITETAGYIPAKVQIEQLIAAGARLGEYRKENYDFGPGEEVPDDYNDPTREANFDLADASRLARVTEQNLNAAAAAASQKADETHPSEPKSQPEGGDSQPPAAAG